MRPDFFNFLCEMALTGEIPWQWNGLPESSESFSATLNAGVLCQFVAVSRRSGLPLGLVRATAPNFFHGHAFLSLYFSESSRRTPATTEAAVLFIDHCFVGYSLRKLYAETLETNLADFASGEGKFFDTEARFRGYTLQQGHPVDKLVLTVDGERWSQSRSDLLAAIRTARLASQLRWLALSHGRRLDLMEAGCRLAAR